jgi:hypothetical protein
MRYGKYHLLVLCAGLAVMRGQQAGAHAAAVVKPAPQKKEPTFSCPRIPPDLLPVSSSKGVARNDLGEMVYVGTWTDSEGIKHDAILTSKGRVVASEGDEIDGKVIVLIRLDAELAFNRSQVVWTAIYANAEPGKSVDLGDASGSGIFFEKRFISTTIWDASGNSTKFALAEDGTLTLKIPAAALNP